MFQKYIDYVKDNPQGLWFKRKIYGWGWTPVKWQGWAVIAAYIIALIKIVWLAEGKAYSDSEATTKILLPMLVLTVLLLFICYKKGEKPGWQWGLGEDSSE